MKVGYPDTMNSAAAASPMKARYTSSGELDDLQAVEVKSGAFAGDGSGGGSGGGSKDNKSKGGSATKKGSAAKYAETPINMKTPVKARSRKSGDINYKKADRLNKRVDRLDKKLKKSGVKKTEGGHYTGNPGYTGDSRREIRLRKQDRKAGAAAGYGNMDEAKSTAKLDKTLAKKGYKRTPVKNRDIVAELRADMKAISEKYNKAEPQSSSKPTSTTTKKKGILAKRKERRAERNPKVAERQKGRAERKELRKNIKTEKARVTTARQERKTSKTTDRLARVKKKVDGKVADVKSGGLGIDQARRNKRKTIAANKVAQKAYNKKKKK